MNYTVCLDYSSLTFNPSNLSSNGFSVYSDADGFTNPIATGIPSSQLFPPPNGTCPYEINGIPVGSTQLLIIDACSGSSNVSSIFTSASISAGNIMTECCYSLIDIEECGNFCDEICAVGFDVFQTSTIGKIVAGELTSSCGTVTDYVIGWYKNGDYSTPQFTSGKGTAFSYQLPHPLTGASSPFVASGNWEGFIHDAIINTANYTNIVSGSGQGIKIPFASCFDTIVVDPFKCSNGTSSINFGGNTLPAMYSHVNSFNGTVNSPTTFEMSFQLTGSIKYVAYAFNGFAVYDDLEISYQCGTPSTTTNPTLYAQSIYLEKIRIGSGVGVYSTPNQYGLGLPSTHHRNNFYDVTTPGATLFSEPLSPKWPKMSPTAGNYKRILDLTTLETSSNPSLPDILTFKVTPNTLNPSTNWDLGIKCLDSVSCHSCYHQPTGSISSSNIPVKVSKITLGRVPFAIQPCLMQNLNLHTTGCSDGNNVSTIQPFMTFEEFTSTGRFPFKAVSNFYSNINTFNSGSYINQITIPKNGTTNVIGNFLIKGQTLCTSFYDGGNNSCTASLNPGTIKYQRIMAGHPLNDVVPFYNSFNPGNYGLPTAVFSASFSEIEDYNWFSQSLAYRMSIMPLETDCTQPLYHSYLTFNTPNPTNPNSNCGDNNSPRSFQFHRPALENTIFDPINRVIQIPQTPAVMDCFELVVPCGNCSTTTASYSNNQQGFNGQAIYYNNRATNMFNAVVPIVTNTSAKYQDPFYNTRGTTTSNNDFSFMSNKSDIYYQEYDRYSLETVPFISSSTSPTGYENLASLTTNPCPNWSASKPMPPGVTMGGVGYYSNRNLRGWGGRFKADFPSLTGSHTEPGNDEFNLYSNVLDNSGQRQSTYTKILTYSGSAITFILPQYFEGGSPQIVIESF